MILFYSEDFVQYSVYIRRDFWKPLAWLSDSEFDYVSVLFSYGPATGNNSGYGPTTGNNSGYGPTIGYNSGYGLTTGNNSGYGPITGYNSGYDPATGYSSGLYFECTPWWQSDLCFAWLSADVQPYHGGYTWPLFWYDVLMMMMIIYAMLNDIFEWNYFWIFALIF